MKEIKLTRGKVALVDDEDFVELNRYRWHVQSDKRTGKCYVMRNYILSDGRKTKRFLHRLIMKAKYIQIIDHIDGNPLNNQKSNLRFCSQLQNAANRNKNRNKVGYKGVYKTKSGKYRVKISCYHLGTFAKEQDAALTYNKKAVELYGEFANLNVIE